MVMRSGVLVTALAVLLGASAYAMASSPPGGHLVIGFGSDNRPGYPALTPTSVPEPQVAVMPLHVSASPNPFGGSVSIQFGPGAEAEVRVRIFSTAGRLVRDLAADRRSSGAPVVRWDGRDDDGQPLAAGIYFYRVSAVDRVAGGRVVLLR